MEEEGDMEGRREMREGKKGDGASRQAQALKKERNQGRPQEGELLSSLLLAPSEADRIGLDVIGVTGLFSF